MHGRANEKDRATPDRRCKQHGVGGMVVVRLRLRACEGRRSLCWLSSPTFLLKAHSGMQSKGNKHSNVEVRVDRVHQNGPCYTAAWKLAFACC